MYYFIKVNLIRPNLIYIILIKVDKEKNYTHNVLNSNECTECKIEVTCRDPISPSPIPSRNPCPSLSRLSSWTLHPNSFFLSSMSKPQKGLTLSKTRRTPVFLEVFNGHRNVPHGLYR